MNQFHGIFVYLFVLRDILNELISRNFFLNEILEREKSDCSILTVEKREILSQ